MGKVTRKICRSSWLDFTIVLGILILITISGIPRYLDSVERSKASEAYSFLSSAYAAQFQFQFLRGVYASDLTELNLQTLRSAYFSIGDVVPGETGSLETSWRITLTRKGVLSRHGPYTVTFGQNGFEPDESGIHRHADICPLILTHVVRQESQEKKPGKIDV